MLSDRERRVLDELERSYGLDAASSPARRSHPRSARHPITVSVVAWVVPLCLFLLLSGAVTSALALAIAAALGWSLWRYWAELGSGFSTAMSSVPDRDETTGESSRGPKH